MFGPPCRCQETGFACLLQIVTTHLALTTGGDPMRAWHRRTTVWASSHAPYRSRLLCVDLCWRIHSAILCTVSCVFVALTLPTPRYKSNRPASIMHRRESVVCQTVTRRDNKTAIKRMTCVGLWQIFRSGGRKWRPRRHESPCRNCSPPPKWPILCQVGR